MEDGERNEGVQGQSEGTDSLGQPADEELIQRGNCVATESEWREKKLSVTELPLRSRLVLSPLFNPDIAPLRDSCLGRFPVAPLLFTPAFDPTRQVIALLCL